MKLFFSSSNKDKTPKHLENTSKNLFNNQENCAVVFQNLRLAVVTACISTENTEAIINPSNSSLTNVTGVSCAIFNKGGKQLNEYCNKIVQQYGKIETGCSVSTDAGNLNCKQVIHAVGPHVFQNQLLAEQQLHSAIYSSLQLCDKHQYQSISIPIMSYGKMVSFSQEKSASIIFNAIIEYILSCATNIKHIRFTNLDKSISETFTKLLHKFQRKYIEVLNSKMTIHQQEITPTYRVSLDSSSSNSSGFSSGRNSYEL